MDPTEILKRPYARLVLPHDDGTVSGRPSTSPVAISMIGIAFSTGFGPCSQYPPEIPELARAGRRWPPIEKMAPGVRVAMLAIFQECQ